MRQIWKPNRALSAPLLLKLLEKAEEMIKWAFAEKYSHMWVVFPTYAVVCYVISLRGVKGLLLDLTGLNRHWRLWSYYWDPSYATLELCKVDCLIEERLRRHFSIRYNKWSTKGSVTHPHCDVSMYDCCKTVRSQLGEIFSVLKDPARLMSYKTWLCNKLW